MCIIPPTSWFLSICRGGTPLPRSCGVFGNSCQDKNNQPIAMHVLMATRERFAWLHCTVATDAPIGCFPIGASNSTKLGVTAQGFVWVRVSTEPTISSGCRTKKNLPVYALVTVSLNLYCTVHGALAMKMITSLCGQYDFLGAEWRKFL
jgi:hypothetical protein